MSKGLEPSAATELRLDIGEAGEDAAQRKARDVTALLTESMVSSAAEQLDAMFDQADDMLFENATSMSSIQDQNLMLATMSFLREEKVRILDGFKKQLINGGPGSKGLLDSRPPGGLEGMAQDTIVAINLTNKIEQKAPFELFELERRITTLKSETKETVDPDLLSPSRIVKAFTSAVSEIQVDSDVRMAIYKLFERVVVNRMPSVFVNANSLLEKNGILPLIAQPPRIGESAKPHVDPAAKADDPLAMRLNAHLAQQMRAENASTGKIRESMQIPSSLPRQSIAAVAHMFASVYSNPEVSAYASQVLSPMQFPLLKAAISDPSFFSDIAHPIRRAANDIFSLVLGLVKRYGKNAEYEAVRSGVSSMIAEFSKSLENKLPKGGIHPEPDIETDLLQSFIEIQYSAMKSNEDLRQLRARRLIAYELKRRLETEPLVQRAFAASIVSAIGPLLLKEYLGSGGTPTDIWNMIWELFERTIELYKTPLNDNTVFHIGELCARVQDQLHVIGYSAVDGRVNLLRDQLQIGANAAYERAAQSQKGDAIPNYTVEEASFDPSPVAADETELIGELLAIILVPNSFFRIRDRDNGTVHYVRVDSFYPRNETVLFRHHLEDRYLRMTNAAVATAFSDEAIDTVDADEAVENAMNRCKALRFTRVRPALLWVNSNGLPVPKEYD